MRWLLLALLASACVPEDGPLMEPGENCLGCHGSGDLTGPLFSQVPRRRGTAFTIAGTAFNPNAADTGVEGAEIQIEDAAGFAFSLRSNLSGNFYSRETVKFPLRACVVRAGRKICQQSPVVGGSCNLCHSIAALQAPQTPLTTP